jgi:hypothetical protein
MKGPFVADVFFSASAFTSLGTRPKCSPPVSTWFRSVEVGSTLEVVFTRVRGSYRSRQGTNEMDVDAIDFGMLHELLDRVE